MYRFTIKLHLRIIVAGKLKGCLMFCNICLHWLSRQFFIFRVLICSSYRCLWLKEIGLPAPNGFFYGIFSMNHATAVTKEHVT